MSKSWRVKLAGQQYVFPNNGAPGIVLGAGLTDPARPAEVGSAIIQSFHGGVGHGLQNGIMQYKSAFRIDPTVPGNVIPGYEPFDVGDPFTADGLVLTRPKFAYVPVEQNNKAYVIAGQRVLSFSPTSPGGGLTDLVIWGGPNDGSPLSAEITDGAAFDNEFTGATFALGDRLFFGTHSTGLFGDAAFTPETHWYTQLGGTNGLAHGGRQASMGASARARAFWIGRNPTSDVPTLYWAPENPDSSSQDLDDGAVTPVFPSTGAGFSVGRPHISWMSMVGPSLIVFRSDGAVMAADESGVLSIAAQITLSDPDPFFGRGACMYQDGLLIPSAEGLFSFELRTLTMRPASPNFVQNQSEERLRGEMTCTAMAGPYAFFGMARPNRKSTGYVMVRYTNMMAVHDVIPETTNQFEIITDMFPYFDRESALTRLYYIVFNENTKSTQVRCVFLRLPPDSGTAETPADGYVELSSFPGATAQGLALKLWTQVRGHFDPGSGNTDTVSLSFEGMTVDGAAVAVAPVFAPEGAFMRPITAAAGDEVNLIGREFSSGKVTFNNPLVDTELRLPLIFDYVWVPSAANQCVLSLMISGEVNGENAALWTKAPWGTTKALLALRNTVTTLEFPEGDTWTVLVQDVKIPDQMAPDSEGQTERIAQVQIRRL